MSLSTVIQSHIDNTIGQYISLIATKFNLDKNELHKLWSGENIPIKAPEVSDDLQKLSRADLVAKCKEKGLKVSGTKVELIQRLNSEPIATPVKSIAKPSVPVKPVLQKLLTSVPSQVIGRNQFGNFEHTISGLVFNNQTKKAYGRQNPDGSVSPLTTEDIELCNKYKFTYNIPENLNKKTLDIKDEDIKELEEDVDEDEVLDDEEELVSESDVEDDEEEEVYYDEE